MTNVVIAANYSDAWEAVLHAINNLHGTITSESRYLGVVAFYVRWGSIRKTSYNVYVRQSKSAKDEVAVHIASWVDGRPGSDGEDVALVAAIKKYLTN